MRSKHDLNLAAYIDQHQRSLRQMILAFNAVDRNGFERRKKLLGQLKDLGSEQDKEFVRRKAIGFLIDYLEDAEIKRVYESVR